MPFKENQYVQRSMVAGKASPRAERLSAPKRDMNKSIYGMATAKQTRTKEEHFSH